MSYRADTLDCQDCGDVIKRLTPSEAQQVAANPYNYIGYCIPCIRDRRIDSRHSSLLMIVEGDK